MKARSRCSASLALLLGLVLVAGLICPPIVVAATNTFNEKSIKQWTLKGPLSERPKRVSEVLPLSDQQNKAGWVRFEPMWDEFDQPTLDTNKWTVGMYWWQGRQPAWFSPRNVVVRKGQLQLTMRREEVPAEMKGRGYHDYTSAALHTKARSSYGYYEVKARPMNSGGSSSFWFQQEDPKVFPGWATEVDVFELCGKSAVHYRRYCMTLHVSATPVVLRVLLIVPEPSSSHAHGHHPQARHPAALSSRVQLVQVSIPLLLQSQARARSQRTLTGTDPNHL